MGFLGICSVPGPLLSRFRSLSPVNLATALRRGLVVHAFIRSINSVGPPVRVGHENTPENEAEQGLALTPVGAAGEDLSNTSRSRAPGGAPSLKGGQWEGRSCGRVGSRWLAGPRGSCVPTGASFEGSESRSLRLTMAVMEISVGVHVKSHQDTPHSDPSGVFPPHAEPAQGRHLETWARPSSPPHILSQASGCWNTSWSVYLGAFAAPSAHSVLPPGLLTPSRHLLREALPGTQLQYGPGSSLSDTRSFHRAHGTAWEFAFVCLLPSFTSISPPDCEFPGGRILRGHTTVTDAAQSRACRSRRCIPMNERTPVAGSSSPETRQQSARPPSRVRIRTPDSAWPWAATGHWWRGPEQAELRTGCSHWAGGSGGHFLPLPKSGGVGTGLCNWKAGLGRQKGGALAGWASPGDDGNWLPPTPARELVLLGDICTLPEAHCQLGWSHGHWPWGARQRSPLFSTASRAASDQRWEVGFHGAPGPRHPPPK